MPRPPFSPPDFSHFPSSDADHIAPGCGKIAVKGSRAGRFDLVDYGFGDGQSPAEICRVGQRIDVTYVHIDWLKNLEIAGPEALDSNPAHIIYECLTNVDWGMGSPLSGADFAAFSEVATTLFDENFCLSMMWTRQAEIQTYVQEVLDHIQGVLFVDPSTGLPTSELIRGDYDESTLPIVTPDNADLTNFGRKLWGDISNEIIVTWTNPQTEQDETVTAHDLASIITQGVVIDSRNYYGVRDASLAAKLAARDLRSSRPAKVTVGTTLFNTVTTPVDRRSRTNPWVTISWANRNRLTEDSQILAWTDASVTPETGQTTTVEVLTQDLATVLATHTGLTGTS